VLLGLDPLGQHDRSGAVGVLPGGGGRHPCGGRRALDQRQVELEDVGLDQRDQGEGVRVGSEVVDRDQVAAVPDAVAVAEQPGRLVGQRPLRELDHRLERQGAQHRDELVIHRQVGSDARLDVDEHQAGVAAGVAGSGQAEDAADQVELGQHPGCARSTEQRSRGLQRRALRATRQDLAAHEFAGAQVDDRLVERGDVTLGDDAGDLVPRASLVGAAAPEEAHVEPRQQDTICLSTQSGTD
jgi:hypothetical protein